MFIVISVVFFSFLLGMLLTYSIYAFPKKKNPIIDLINNLLPQSQCGKCGYSSCLLYAKAIVKKNEKVDKCTPGGNDLILKISQSLNINNSLNSYLKDSLKNVSTTVQIDEKNCIGCSKCVLFCPVDAIIGAPNFTHTVLQVNCTGCNICLLHCPTNCIKIIEE